MNSVPGYWVPLAMVIASLATWLGTRRGFNEVLRRWTSAEMKVQALQRLQVPPSIAAIVIQRYRLDATCPNCHALVEHGCVAFCKKCDFEHETLRRDPVVRAALAFVQVGREHSQTGEKFKALAAMLEIGGWLK